jgi:hypothetical protein
MAPAAIDLGTYLRLGVGTAFFVRHPYLAQPGIGRFFSLYLVNRLRRPRGPSRTDFSLDSWRAMCSNDLTRQAY